MTPSAHANVELNIQHYRNSLKTTTDESKRLISTVEPFGDSLSAISGCPFIRAEQPSGDDTVQDGK